MTQCPEKCHFDQNFPVLFKKTTDECIFEDDFLDNGVHIKIF